MKINPNWNANGLSEFEAEKQIYVNVRNPYYHYVGNNIPSTNIRGVYSRSNNFTTVNTSYLKSDLNFAQANNFPQGFTANPPFTNWIYTDYTLENCCTSSLHLSRKKNPNLFNEVEDNLKSEILIYPNPASNYCFIKLNNIEKDKQITISIYNLYGQMIYTQNQTPQSTNITIPITLKDNLSKGMYLIKCEQNNQSVESKLILN